MCAFALVAGSGPGLCGPCPVQASASNGRRWEGKAEKADKQTRQRPVEDEDDVVVVLQRVMNAATAGHPEDGEL